MSQVSTFRGPVEVADLSARRFRIAAIPAAGILTRDLGGAASTEDVTRALIDALNP